MTQILTTFRRKKSPLTLASIVAVSGHYSRRNRRL